MKDKYSQDPLDMSAFDTSIPRPEAIMDDEDGPDTSVDGDTEQLVFPLPPMGTTARINADIINSAYEGWKAALLRRQSITQSKVIAQTDLKRATATLDYQKNDAIISGRNVGKNAEQREAMNHMFFEQEYVNLERLAKDAQDMELTDNYAAMVVSLWEIEVQRVDKLMGLLMLDDMSKTK